MTAIALKAIGKEAQTASKSCWANDSNFRLGGQVNAVELGMMYLPGSGSPNQVMISVVPDVDGKPSESVIWQESFLDAVPTTYGQIATFLPSDGPTLEQNKKYWLTTMSPSVGFRPHVWWSSSTVNTEPRAIKYLRGGGVFTENVWTTAYPSETVYSFTLRVTVVAEPTTTATLLTLGVCTLFWDPARRPRHRT
jgi:hypothetical protein